MESNDKQLSIFTCELKTLVCEQALGEQNLPSPNVLYDADCF